ncbi:MAG TPA: phosphoribosylanthranilate isomerase, partial [Tepidisphaeraceae bacterium]|nr:phosphoribosylanthranilate isomerase [Tepidisphaeraceae bacterium]
MDIRRRALNNPTMRTRVKICGVTRPEDAALAARLGADAVGVVCYPKARRYVPLERAREIVAAVPAFVTPVLLFVDQAVDEIVRVAGELGVRTIQLHGHEGPEVVAALRGYSVLKALRTDRATLPGELAAWREAVARLGLVQLQGLVMETAAAAAKDGAPGGTGVENDFAYLAELRGAGAFEGLPSLIAAGGLRSENVGEVVRAVRPYAVDVSSGVEGAFG